MEQKPGYGEQLNSDVSHLHRALCDVLINYGGPKLSGNLGLSIQEHSYTLQLSGGQKAFLQDQATQMYHKDYDDITLEQMGGLSERAQAEVDDAPSYYQADEQTLFFITRGDYFMKRGESFVTIGIGPAYDKRHKKFVIGKPYLSAGNWNDMTKEFGIESAEPDKVAIYSYDTKTEVTDLSTEPELAEALQQLKALAASFSSRS